MQQNQKDYKEMWFTLFYMAECTDHDFQINIPDPTVKVTKLQVSLVGSLFHPFHKHITVMVRTFMYHIYRVSQEECARLRENVPYVKVY